MKITKKKMFDSNLSKIIRRNKLIPSRIKNTTHLSQFHKYYYDANDSYFKVLEIFEIDDQEYYEVKFSESLYSIIPYPLDSTQIYELFVDNRNIAKTNIINSQISFLGRDIKYWFFLHNLENDGSGLNEFWAYLNPNSNRLINDNKYYYVSAKECIDGDYKNCKIVLDSENEKNF